MTLIFFLFKIANVFILGYLIKKIIEQKFLEVLKLFKLKKKN